MSIDGLGRERSSELRDQLSEELGAMLTTHRSNEARRRVWSRVVSDILEDDPSAGLPPARPESKPNDAEGVA